MKKGSIIFLKIVICLIGILTLALMLWEPHLEGRNVNATVFEIYFKDPFLAYVYIGSIPFFFALYQAIKLLSYIDKNKIFSQHSVKAVRNIKYCGIALVIFIIGAEGYLFIFERGKDDITGAVMLGLIAIFITSVVTTAAGVFQKLLQNAVDLKAENDLTV
ncbi:MAG: DUF2975 domain-containing protein [Ignavibacteriales bacterium]|nr:MAG: DUF2975 domain-containing protein [Ignavibacteriales bacterium]